MCKGYVLDISKTPTGPPTHRVPKAPSKKKKQFKNPIIFKHPPKVNVISPKVNVISPKVNVMSRKVNVQYFSGIFEEFEVFEIFCSGVTVTGASNIFKVCVAG